MSSAQTLADRPLWARVRAGNLSALLIHSDNAGHQGPVQGPTVMKCTFGVAGGPRVAGGRLMRICVYLFL